MEGRDGKVPRKLHLAFGLKPSCHSIEQREVLTALHLPFPRLGAARRSVQLLLFRSVFVLSD